MDVAHVSSAQTGNTKQVRALQSRGLHPARPRHPILANDNLVLDTSIEGYCAQVVETLSKLSGQSNEENHFLSRRVREMVDFSNRDLTSKFGRTELTKYTISKFTQKYNYHSQTTLISLALAHRSS